LNVFDLFGGFLDFFLAVLAGLTSRREKESETQAERVKETEKRNVEWIEDINQPRVISLGCGGGQEEGVMSRRGVTGSHSGVFALKTRYDGDIAPNQTG
jgi:hypothetical protein